VKDIDSGTFPGASPEAQEDALSLNPGYDALTALFGRTLRTEKTIGDLERGVSGGFTVLGIVAPEVRAAVKGADRVLKLARKIEAKVQVEKVGRAWTKAFEATVDAWNAGRKNGTAASRRASHSPARVAPEEIVIRDAQGRVVGSGDEKLSVLIERAKVMGASRRGEESAIEAHRWLTQEWKRRLKYLR
jgi:hypothetical protein